MRERLRHLRTIWLALGACTLLVAGAAIGWAASAGTPEAKRIPLAQTKHVRGAPDRTLGLTRVEIPAGAKLALHHHQGTQIAYIDSGVLTYTVVEGHVKVRRGTPGVDAHVVKKITAGHTGRIKPGEWIVEQPTDHHKAANKGHQKITIFLSTLLKTGAPPSTPG
jgi:mannose-6-phosphate isomerase-like protein (cupin superfamily)